MKEMTPDEESAVLNEARADARRMTSAELIDAYAKAILRGDIATSRSLLAHERSIAFQRELKKSKATSNARFGRMRKTMEWLAEQARRSGRELEEMRSEDEESA